MECPLLLLSPVKYSSTRPQLSTHIMIFAFLTYNINEILIMKNQIDADGRSKGRKSQMNIYKTRDIFVANSNFAWKWMDCPALPSPAPPRPALECRRRKKPLRSLVTVWKAEDIRHSHPCIFSFSSVLCIELLWLCLFLVHVCIGSAYFLLVAWPCMLFLTVLFLLDAIGWFFFFIFIFSVFLHIVWLGDFILFRM